MPWKVHAMPDVRFTLAQSVRCMRLPVAEAARRFGVSRKTVRVLGVPDGPMFRRLTLTEPRSDVRPGEPPARQAGGCTTRCDWPSGA